MKRLPTILLFLLCGANVAMAQTAPLRLTLDDAIARGIEASYRLEELGARQDAARAIEEQREAAERPQLAAIAGYTRINHVDEFSVPNAGGGVPGALPRPHEPRAVADRSAMVYLHRRPPASAHPRCRGRGRSGRTGSRGGARRSQARNHTLVPGRDDSARDAGCRTAGAGAHERAPERRPQSAERRPRSAERRLDDRGATRP